MRSVIIYPFFLVHLTGILLHSIQAQEYQVTLLYIPCAEVSMSFPQPNQIRFTTKTKGIINYIWPADNEYVTTFDTVTFALREYSKRIKQGTFDQTFHSQYNLEKGTLDFPSESRPRPREIQSIFTFLVRAQRETVEELDTHWFTIDHEGRLFKGRFLWADSVNIKALGKEIPCDHYRLDLIPLEQSEGEPILTHSDYFMSNIIADNVLRQLWVERGAPRRIIKASVTVYGIPVEALITND